MPALQFWAGDGGNFRNSVLVVAVILVTEGQIRTDRFERCFLAARGSDWVLDPVWPAGPGGPGPVMARMSSWDHDSDIPTIIPKSQLLGVQARTHGPGVEFQPTPTRPGPDSGSEEPIVAKAC